MAKDCGLDSLLPRHWVAPVDGVLPGSGFRVSWDALWADLVAGVSAENFVHGGKPGVKSEALLEFMQTKLNSTQVGWQLYNCSVLHCIALFVHCSTACIATSLRALLMLLLVTGF